ncbi:unnamed protein product [Heligmosomoides polygyrus]|uniref:Reverse transcriptase domain-containing protein n=1 Tax=Heligmosomoides polygyrus TaxID=6339 RepID=A0A3P8BJ64_HELPZ|nr:unnamed protein product [Heligmosomoides polygyrus]
MMDWAKTWDIPVNLEKTVVLHIGKPDNPEYYYNGTALKVVKEMSLDWLGDNISILPSLTPRSGNHLEHLLGREYIFVKDALMALELLSANGIITPTELAMSEDSHILRQVRPPHNSA